MESVDKVAGIDVHKRMLAAGGLAGRRWKEVANVIRRAATDAKGIGITLVRSRRTVRIIQANGFKLSTVSPISTAPLQLFGCSQDSDPFSCLFVGHEKR